MNNKYQKLSHWLPLGLAGFVIAGYLAGGAWNWFTPVAIFGGLTLADLVLGESPRQFDEATARQLDADRQYYLPLYVYVPLHFGLLAWGLTVIATGQLAFIPAVGFSLSIGIITGGVGITVAHELGHRRNWHDVFLARLLLASVCYMHFHIEHNKGHHSMVATWGDSASARFGESFYKFFPRTFRGSYLSALGIERDRISKSTKSGLTQFNQVYIGVAASLGFAAISIALAGITGLLFFLFQALVAVILLELVNYVEHYGLERRSDGKGGYETVNLMHSWNSSRRISNFLLFNLQRHSHHHIHQGRKYQSLQDFDDSPQLPIGYTGMAILALVPALWFSVMNRRCVR